MGMNSRRLSSISKQKGSSRVSTRKNRSLSSARPLPHEEVEWNDVNGYTKEYPRDSSYYKGRAKKEGSLNVATVSERTTAPQETMLAYAGEAKIPITSTLQLIRPEDDTPRGIWPVFRLMVSRSNQI